VNALASDADAAEDHRQARLRLLAQRGSERRPGGQVIQNGTELDLIVDLHEALDAFLQAPGDGEVPGFDDVPGIGLRCSLPHDR
jgi:hypothetical protein